MATILYGIDGEIINHHDLQDKAYWCREGESLEASFVQEFGTRLNYSLNPDKNKDRFAPDLVHTITGNFADLKIQNTPFFKSQELYDIESTYAVVFNEKDKRRYEKLYPNIEILYYVDWVAVKAIIKNKIYTTPKLTGIFRAEFSKLRDYLETVQIHYYQQRRFDNKGNAKGSYVLDIRNPIFTQIA